MKPIALDRNARRRLMGQLCERRRGDDVPVRWHEFLDRLSHAGTGVGAGERTAVDAVVGRARLFCWQPTVDALAVAARGKGLIYLCWGAQPSRRHPLGPFVSILKRAEVVLVNDVETAREIVALARREPRVVPFFVDMDFFSYMPTIERDTFVFCNGSNDRDPDLLMRLAADGLRVVWLANFPSHIERFRGQHPNLVVLNSLSFAEVRKLYQTCSVMIMPAVRDTHCAGQTTVMEAISCGAPVVIGEGRTATIFAGLPTVVTVRGSGCSDWQDGIAAAAATAQSARLESRIQLARRIAPESIWAALAPVFGWSDMSLVAAREFCAGQDSMGEGRLHG